MRNDFSGHLHKFMAHLTDAQHKPSGHTVLYVPDEGPKMDNQQAMFDKDLVQRLEGKDSWCSPSPPLPPTFFFCHFVFVVAFVFCCFICCDVYNLSSPQAPPGPSPQGGQKKLVRCHEVGGNALTMCYKWKVRRLFSSLSREMLTFSRLIQHNRTKTKTCSYTIEM